MKKCFFSYLSLSIRKCFIALLVVAIVQLIVRYIL